MVPIPKLVANMLPQTDSFDPGGIFFLFFASYKISVVWMQQLVGCQITGSFMDFYLIMKILFWRKRKIMSI